MTTANQPKRQVHPQNPSNASHARVPIVATAPPADDLQTPPAHTEPTAAWRASMDEGNVQYAAAKDAPSSTARTSAVKQALTKYNAALQLTKISKELASTNKNMSLACGLVVVDDDADPENRYYFLSEALTSAAMALAYATQGKMSAQWISEVLDKLNDLVDKSLVELAASSAVAPGGVVQLLTKLVHNSATQPHVRIVFAKALLDRANKKGAHAISEGEYNRAAEVTDERAELRSSVLEWVCDPLCEGLKPSVDEVNSALLNTMCLASVKKLLQRGKALREESVADVGIDMEKVFEAMDTLRLGVVECQHRKLHIDIEAELLSEIGYIWSNILKVDEPAYRAYHASVQCALACPRMFTGNWFKRANDAVEKHQQAEAAEEQRKNIDVHEAIRKSLASELATLAAKNTSIEDILTHVTTTYPGRVAFDKYNPTRHGLGKDAHYLKLLKKVVGNFHANNTTTQTPKVQMLYGEITRVLTNYINAEKQCD
ncbi:Hypothetical protein, putative [Bodo saltans]|uniref:Uncharacterized protein n=1 Tax=Bodo saltans TaxID=75058 RepID=A0A0S4IS77_BODSA|nr:Hypothetical protein, putative [Bodo saltans]|eukprot:CUF46680.1 Hypothetical protein, putative [Bodo saltans]